MKNEWLPAFLFVASFAIALEPKSIDFEGVPTREQAIRESVWAPVTIDTAAHLCTSAGGIARCVTAPTYPMSSTSVTTTVSAAR